MASTPGRRVLVVHPSAELYGSDLQLVQTVAALTRRGWQATVVLPEQGPLVARLICHGARVIVQPFPVLRRSVASVSGLGRLAGSLVCEGRLMRRIIRGSGAQVVLVNTVTIPWWLGAARSCQVPVVCHVHEAETADARVLREALTRPLALADRVIFNGRTSAAAATELFPWIAEHATVIPNGVPGPPQPVREVDWSARPVRAALVSRLSPRKNCLDAIKAVGHLRHRGLDIELDVYGSTYPGYEWYERELRAWTSALDLTHSVRLHGYLDSVWHALETAHLALAPSARESFGNNIVEAQHAGRLVVAAGAGGHLESVRHGHTGLFFRPGDPLDLAEVVQRAVSRPDLADQMAGRARQEAGRRFGVAAYGARMAAALEEVRGERAERRGHSRRAPVPHRV